MTASLRDYFRSLGTAVRIRATPERMFWLGMAVLAVIYVALLLIPATGVGRGGR